jgi:diguanylate cyclase (GGDEF)-like protein/PAS domain S-box-containing protein
LKTLVYDDDPVTRHWLEAALKARGHEVTACSEPDAARSEIAASRPSLAIVDWAGTEGLDLCRWIRSLPDGYGTVILAAGLSDRPSDLHDALDGGADDYLSKEVDAGTLAGRLAVAERRGQRREVRARSDSILRFLHKAVETTGIGISVTDTAGRILYANPAEAGMHGHATSDLLGLDARSLSPQEDGAPMGREQLRQAGPWRRDGVRLRKDGTRFSVRLHSDVLADDYGNPVGLVTTCEDITDRRRAEAALRESEERYRSLVETAQDVIALVSPDLTLAAANPAFEALTGWAPAEWVGKGFGSLVHPDDRATVEAVFARALKGEAPHAAEFRVQTRSGEGRVLECTATPQVRNGLTVGALVISRDITERKRLQQREATLHAAARAIEDAPSLPEMGPRLLHTICVGLGWEVGLLWIKGRRESLECHGIWHLPEVDVAPLKDAVQNLAFAKGRGLPGQAWASGAPLWVPELPDDPHRVTAGGAARLRSALLFPLLSEGEAWGVVELFSPESREKDAPLLKVAEELGHQIGQALGRRLAKEALKESEERYALTARGANDGFWDWDLRRDEIHFSERWKAMLGYADHEVGTGSGEWLSRIHPEDSARVREKIAAHRGNASAPFEQEYRMRHKDGTYRWVFGRGFALRDSEGKAYRMAGAQTDVTDRRAHDALTGLPNRALFAERLSQALARSKRRGGPLFAVLFVDLDHFKSANDLLGHLAGDQLLVSSSKRIESCVRPGDMVSRFGGDEFAILLDGISGLGDATRVADRIQKELAAPFEFDGQEIVSSASVGIAMSTRGYGSVEDLLRDADAAMYRAKTLGGGRFEVCDEAMRTAILARRGLEQDVRRGLEKGEFHAHYQPIVSVATGRAVGLEALMRWHHPSGKLLLPSEFAAVAEETGLIVPIGYALLQEACHKVREWEGQNAGARARFVSLNLSPRQCAERGLVEKIRGVLDECGLAPEALHLEITEETLSSLGPPAARCLGGLRALGVLVDLDRFGRGPFTLDALQRLPIGGLKAEPVLLAGVNGRPPSLLRGIAQLAHDLGKTVIATGVENHRQLARLRKIRCPLAQGFYFSRAVQADEVPSLLGASPPWQRAFPKRSLTSVPQGGGRSRSPLSFSV